MEKRYILLLFKSSRSDTKSCPLGHISHCGSNISHFRRKYIIFPSGKISLGAAKIPFRNPLWGVFDISWLTGVDLHFCLWQK